MQGPGGSLAARVNVAALVYKHAGRTDAVRQVDFLIDLLLQGDRGETAAAARQKLLDFLVEGTPRGGALDHRLRETAHAVLLMPEYQLA